jgi:putative transposase
MDTSLACRDIDMHFITCTCYDRRALLGSARRRDVFVDLLEQVRRCYQFPVVGYVVMPDHFHLLIGDPPHKPISVAVQALELAYASRVMAQARRRSNPDQGDLFDHAPQCIWEEQFCDSKVATDGERVERLRHLHRNPVKRGLVASPELWAWSRNSQTPQRVMPARNRGKNPPNQLR